MNADDVIEKIKKAVRLANRTTEEGERETALRLARGLAEKNGIAFEDIEQTDCDADRCVHEIEDEYHTCDGVELGFVSHILWEHFGVVFMLHQLKGKSWKARKSWFGTHINIEIAKHVYHILIRESRRAYSEAVREKIAAIDRRNEEYLRSEFEEWGLDSKAVSKILRAKVNRKSFMRGFFYAIDKKLKEHPLRNDIESCQKETEKKIEEFKKENQVRQSKQRTDKNQDSNDIMAGFSSGNKVNLARPCNGTDSSPLSIAL